jgi:hypothetical protein
MTGAVIYVDVKQSRRLWPLTRPQRWYWIALNGNNMRRLARSSETYTNRQDALDAVTELFGTESNVYKREAEMGNQLLRLAE